MAKFRLKEEKLHRVRLGSRYFGFNLAQFCWECLKLVAGSEQLRETDIVRRIIGSWIETLPPAIQEKARAEANRAEAWKAQELLARRHAKRQAKRAKLRASGKAAGGGISRVSRIVSPATTTRSSKPVYAACK